MKRIFAILTVGVMALAASAQISYDNTKAKADRFFSHQEWASAAAMYNFMLQEQPKESDTYGRAIVATEMLGDTLRSMQLLNDAMRYGVPLDSVLTNVRRYAFQQDQGALYEKFMYQAIDHNPWMERPIDAYLLDYYVFRRNGQQMVAYSDKMLRGTPDNVKFMQSKAEGYMINNQPQQAVATWQRILELQPSNYTAIINLANYYDMVDDRAQALKYFREARTQKSTPYVDQAIRRLEDPHYKDK